MPSCRTEVDAVVDAHVKLDAVVVGRIDVADDLALHGCRPIVVEMLCHHALALGRRRHRRLRCEHDG